ncbi:MAG: flagellar biosynthetic protein FliO [Proteobacteria bacterium]|nr:flagellar biosynthetic protein FliO [Pseudomonadota bacterium]MBU1059932.1 flagellar biosynthetic protein FliO [Pseudomonadota bacterium]
MAAGTDTSLASAGLRMLWGLLVVLGLLLIIYGLARKRLSLAHSNRKSQIKILETRHLMAKKSLCLVEVAGREYLLGLGNDTITLLATLDAEKNHNFSATLETATEQHEQNSI